MSITFGSLFAGIGGFGLGFERAGMVCKWQVENNEFCLKVLDKHWPDVPKYKDVRYVGKYNLEFVDVICGGFPCQDISKASKGKGIKGERSGLWYEYQRIIGEMQPRWVVIENVKNIYNRGFEEVLAGLWEVGYDAEWSIISACAFGASHTRERMFIVAYPNSQRCEGGTQDYKRVEEAHQIQDVNREECTCAIRSDRTGILTRNGDQSEDRGSRFRQSKDFPSWPETKTRVGRIAYGIPRGMDRLRALGNAVVPQVAEWIGRRILEIEVKDEIPQL